MTATTTAPAATAATRAGLLRRALHLDAIASGATGALLLVAAVPLTDVLGTAVWFERAVGGFLLGYAAAVLVVAARAVPARRPVLAVIAFNAVWTLDSLLFAVAGWFPLTAIGVAFVLAQAAAVAGFGLLQAAGLRRIG